MRKKILILLSTFCLLSCYEPPREGFSTEERKMIDSIYTSRVIGLTQKADSLCAEYRAKNFDHLVDSVKAEYLSEIKNIMK